LPFIRQEYLDLLSQSSVCAAHSIKKCLPRIRRPLERRVKELFDSPPNFLLHARVLPSGRYQKSSAHTGVLQCRGAVNRETQRASMIYGRNYSLQPLSTAVGQM
jgi:hypothetical protein